MSEHSIGKTIASLRKSKGWTQVELAEKLNVSDKAVSKWESEAGFPEISQLPALANLFGVTIDYIMTGKTAEKERILNSKAKSVKVSFVNKIADDYILNVTYTEADKEQYYAKLEQERKDKLLTTAEIKVSTGADLVNIYFQPCCDEYDHTEIKLFVPKDYVTTGGHDQKKPSDWSIIKKCDVPTEDFYQSITGLAYGKYAFILKQFDKNNQLLLETNYIEFLIMEPNKPECGQLNII